MIFLFLALFVYSYRKGKKKHEKEQLALRTKSWDIPTTSGKKDPTRYKRPKGSISELQTIGPAVQLLESLEIVSETKNFETLESRFQLIYELVEKLSFHTSRSTYLKLVKRAIDNYQQNYYDRTVTELQKEVLTELDLATVKLIHAEALQLCFERFVEKKAKEMNKLKTAVAIEKRREDIIRVGYSVKYMFKTYQLPDNGNIEAIENLRKQYFVNKNK